MNIKRLSYPPFIVFFDTLAIILFLLMLNQNQNPIDIEIPPENVFEGGEVLIRENGILHDIDNIEHEIPKGKKEYYLTCGKQDQCNKAKLEYPNAEKFYILLPDKLFEKASKLTFLILRTTNCKSVKYVINNNGELIYKKINEKQDECFSKIHGFDETSKVQ